MHLTLVLCLLSNTCFNEMRPGNDENEIGFIFDAKIKCLPSSKIEHEIARPFTASKFDCNLIVFALRISNSINLFT